VTIAGVNEPAQAKLGRGTLLSGDGGGSPGHPSPTCWGCTLLVSYDRQRWYEIIPLQEVLTQTKHDLSATQ